MRRAIVAHTGALAGNTALRDAWLEGRGAVLVDDPVTMFEAAVLLSHTRRVRGGVAAALQSGGACTLFAESAGAAGLPLPDFAPATKRALRRRAAGVRVAEQPARRDRPGRGGDRHVRRGAGRARAGPVGRAGGVRRVPTPAAGRDCRGPIPSSPRPCALPSETGVVFASVSMSPLAFGAGGEGVRPALAGAAVPPGSPRRGRARSGAARAAARARPAPCGRTAPARGTGARRCGWSAARAARWTRRGAARVLELYGVRRPDGGGRRLPGAGRGRGRPDRRTGGGQGAGARAPAQGAAGRRSVWGCRAEGRRRGRGGRRARRRLGGPAPCRRRCSCSGWPRGPRCSSARWWIRGSARA